MLNWGDVPTWLATIGGAVALIFAWRQWRQDASAATVGREAFRRSHAVQLAAWIEGVDAAHLSPKYEPDVPRAVRVASGREARMVPGVVMSNASSHSYRNVQVWARFGKLQFLSGPHIQLAPQQHDTAGNKYFMADLETLPPGKFFGSSQMRV